jgi:hypothetical protein
MASYEYDATNINVFMCNQGLHISSLVSSANPCLCPPCPEIYRLHKVNDCFMQSLSNHHTNFTSDCYYKVTRPVWKECCNTLLDDDDIQCVDRFYKMLHIKCVCTTQHICRFCFYMQGRDGQDPTIPIDGDNCISLWTLREMHTSLKSINKTTKSYKKCRYEQ